MADEVIYKRSGEKYHYEYDFTPKLTGDTSITSGSTVTATDEEGTDASSTVVANKAQSGMVLSADLIAGTDGKDYSVIYRGVGTTSSLPRDWVVEMRVRDKLGGVV